VLAYNVGGHKSQGDSTIYQQQIRHIQNNTLAHSLSRLFVVEFISQLQTWQRQGNHLLIFIDMNKHVLNRHLAKYIEENGFKRGDAPGMGH
jgi:hypothetical protein